MAEAVGVAAAAAQLASLCFSTLMLLEKIKGAPSSLEYLHRQLQEVRALSDTISQNPLLQTAEVETHTRSLVSLLDPTCFESLAQKNRILRVLWFIQQEKNLAETFIAIERQKTSLSLVIEDIQSRTLHEIKTDLSIMASNTNNSNDVGSGRNESYLLERTDRGVVRFARQLRQPADAELVRVSRRCDYSPASTQSGDNHASPNPSQPRSEYTNCTASDGVNQINGSLHKTDSSRKISPGQGRYSYNNCNKTGDGKQVNGPVVYYVGDGTPPEAPALDARWRDCAFTGGKGDEGVVIFAEPDVYGEEPSDSEGAVSTSDEGGASAASKERPPSTANEEKTASTAGKEKPAATAAKKGKPGSSAADEKASTHQQTQARRVQINGGLVWEGEGLI